MPNDPAFLQAILNRRGVVGEIDVYRCTTRVVQSGQVLVIGQLYKRYVLSQRNVAGGGRYLSHQTTRVLSAKR